jgi:hypothetical protein
VDVEFGGGMIIPIPDGAISIPVLAVLIGAIALAMRAVERWTR